MNEPVKIIEQDDQRLIDARELHEALGVKSQFTHWINNRIKDYGYAEGEDYFSSLGESTGGRPEKKYLLTVETAKVLAVAEKNEKGREIRRYFIELEKAWNSPEALINRAVQLTQVVNAPLYGRTFRNAMNTTETLLKVAGKTVRNQDIALAARNAKSALYDLAAVCHPVMIKLDITQTRMKALMAHYNLDWDAVGSIAYEVEKQMGRKAFDALPAPYENNGKKQLPSCAST